MIALSNFIPFELFQIINVIENCVKELLQNMSTFFLIKRGNPGSEETRKRFGLFITKSISLYYKTELVHSLQLDIRDSGFDLGIWYSQYFQI